MSKFSEEKALAPKEFLKWRSKNQKIIENKLAQILSKLEHNQAKPIKRLIEAMSYSLLSGGKKLRPLLALAAAEAVGGKAVNALPAALALEMAHVYSLIHDDLPAMDNDELRRGRPSCHKAFDEATAILAGDALLTLSFEIILSGAKNTEDKIRRVEATVHFAKSLGTLGMIGGQSLDIAFEGENNISPDMVRDMEIRKTGELISTSLVCGSILAAAAPRQIKNMKELGLKLGLAFQIQDDLLDLHGDPQFLGKTTGSDAKRGKATYPAVLGKDEAVKTFDSLALKCIADVNKLGPSASNLRYLIESLIGRQS